LAKGQRETALAFFVICQFISWRFLHFSFFGQ